MLYTLVCSGLYSTTINKATGAMWSYRWQATDRRLPKSSNLESNIYDNHRSYINRRGRKYPPEATSSDNPIATFLVFLGLQSRVVGPLVSSFGPLGKVDLHQKPLRFGVHELPGTITQKQFRCSGQMEIFNSFPHRILITGNGRKRHFTELFSPLYRTVGLEQGLALWCRNANVLRWHMGVCRGSKY
jgi:hypothetical protein